MEDCISILLMKLAIITKRPFKEITKVYNQKLEYLTVYCKLTRAELVAVVKTADIYRGEINEWIRGGD